MDCTPPAFLLNSLANQRLSWVTALAELIDNSLDSGADKIEIIKHASGKLSVRDNGCGVANIASLGTPGRHEPNKSTSLGMYGIGAKDAWLWSSSVMRVETVRDGVYSEAVFDVKHLIENNWQAPDPNIVACDAPTGTTITFSCDIKKPPVASAFEKLSVIFRPALEDGKSISYRLPGGEVIDLKPRALPKLENVVDQTFAVHGRDVHIYIGTLPDGQSMDGGPFWLQYGHRVIDDKTSIGSKDKNAKLLGGLITISSGWPLSKNKDAIGGPTDTLQDCIYDRIEHLLEYANQLSYEITTQEMLSTISSEFADKFRLIGDQDTAGDRVKEARTSGNAKGTVEPSNTGRRRQRAKRIHPESPGSVIDALAKEASKNGFRIDVSRDTSKHIGSYDAISNKVMLNELNPFVARILAETNTAAIKACAMFLLAEYAVENETAGQKLFRFSYDGYGDVATKVALAICS